MRGVGVADISLTDINGRLKITISKKIIDLRLLSASSNVLVICAVHIYVEEQLKTHFFPRNLAGSNGIQIPSLLLSKYR
jgi:hypothetical protein